MKILIRRLTAFAFTLSFSTFAWPDDLAGKWDLKIEDRDHRVATVLVIEFTDQRAPSCIAGKWLRVNVVSATTNDKRFYPSTDPLSYSVENKQLTIGRNEICDAYLMLRGTLNGEVTRGEYFSLGWVSSTPLGFFTLTRER